MSELLLASMQLAVTSVVVQAGVVVRKEVALIKACFMPFTSCLQYNRIFNPAIGLSKGSLVGLVLYETPYEHCVVHSLAKLNGLFQPVKGNIYLSRESRSEIGNQEGILLLNALLHSPSQL